MIVSAMPCLGASVAMPAATTEIARAAAAMPTSVHLGATASVPTFIAASQPSSEMIMATGASATSLPAVTCQRGSGRDHKYVIVRSSISSPIDDATNIAGTTDSTNISTT